VPPVFGKENELIRFKPVHTGLLCRVLSRDTTLFLLEKTAQNRVKAVSAFAYNLNLFLPAYACYKRVLSKIITFRVITLKVNFNIHHIYKYIL